MVSDKIFIVQGSLSNLSNNFSLKWILYYAKTNINFLDLSQQIKLFPILLTFGVNIFFQSMTEPSIISYIPAIASFVFAFISTWNIG